jgi:hypothetical protein
MAQHHLRQGDTTPPFRTRLRDEGGNNVDLTASTVRLHARDDYDYLVKIDAVAVVDPDQTAIGNRGYVDYTFVPADTDTAGRFLAEWEVTFPSGKVQTFPTRGYDRIYIYGQIA